MDWDVTQVRIVDDLTLHVSFRDGIAGLVHFERTFFTGVFAPLRDANEFRKVEFKDGFVSWPSSSVDLAPDAMHDEIKANKKTILK